MTPNPHRSPSVTTASCRGGFRCPNRLNTKLDIYLLLLAGFLARQPELLAQEKSRYTLPDDPTKAWAEVQKVHQALRPPDAWRTNEPKPDEVAGFQKQVRQTA